VPGIKGRAGAGGRTAGAGAYDRDQIIGCTGGARSPATCRKRPLGERMRTAEPSPQRLTHPFVAGLPTRLIEELAPLARETHFASDQAIFREGEDCHDCTWW